jgi:hypothetical protein
VQKIDGVLTGHQLRNLEIALLDAYRSYDELERLLAYSLDRRLSHHADGGGTLKRVVFQLIQAAQSEGWMDSFIEAVIEDRPGNTALMIWFETCKAGGVPVPQPPPLADHEVLDSAFFDLEPIKKKVLAVRRESTERVLGFGLRSGDGLVVSKLCAWLPHCLGETECKDWLSLRPDRGSVDFQLKQVRGYLPDLEMVNVVCPILTDGASAPVVVAFWNGLREHFGLHPYRFVALFVGAIDYPPGVVPLPRPAADATDVTLWAQQLVSRRGWPPMLADHWTTLIVDRCSTGDDLDMRLLFEAMDRSIRDVRRSPSDFRRQLEELGSRADPSPR